MKGKILIFFTAVLALLALGFSGGKAKAAQGNNCLHSRIAYIPSIEEDNDAEAILIGHSHLYSAPEKAKKEIHRFKLRGLQRSFSLANLNVNPDKSAPVAAASLKAPPRYTAPHCLYPQHNYLFRLTPF